MTSSEQNSEMQKEDNPPIKNENENPSPNIDKKMEMEKVSEEKDKYLDLNLITRKWRVKFYRLRFLCK